jgi:Spy/CpxP family protein refolding chaperone
MGIDRVWYAHALAKTAQPSEHHHLTFSLQPPTPEQRALHQEQLAERLHLSDTQRQQFDSVMQRGAAQFDSLRAAVRPQVEQLVNNIRQQIEQILTPEQRELFIKMRTEQRSGK